MAKGYSDIDCPSVHIDFSSKCYDVLSEVDLAVMRTIWMIGNDIIQALQETNCKGAGKIKQRLQNRINSIQELNGIYK
jgi:hypothetical protein